MSIDELNKPIVLVDNNFTIVEQVDNIEYLKKVNSLGLKSKSLIDCYLVDKKIKFSR